MIRVHTAAVFCPSDACEVSLDPNTAQKNLKLTNSNTKVIMREEQPYPDHPQRFDFWNQVLSTRSLAARSYWEVEGRGDVHVAVTYTGIRRLGNGDECRFGRNERSWCLSCSDGGYSVWHNNSQITFPPPSACDSHQVAVYVDRPAGTLSFYRVSSDVLIHLHTFHCSFTEPLLPAFGLGFRCSSSSGSRLRSCSSLSLHSLSNDESELFLRLL